MKRLLALVMTTLMLLSLLSGCGSAEAHRKRENQEFNWVKLTLGVFQLLGKSSNLSLPQSTLEAQG